LVCFEDVTGKGLTSGYSADLLAMKQ